MEPAEDKIPAADRHLKQPEQTDDQQQVEQIANAWVLTPWIHGRTTRLQPMVILSLVLIGGELGGFWGLLLAIPVAICLDILAREFLLPRLRPPSP